jgi:O-antigen ligase
LIGTARAGLPGPYLARWASILFTRSISTLLISLAASQAFLFVAGALYALHLLRDQPPVTFPPVKLPLALFSITTILSVFWAANPAAGWFVVRKLVLFVVWLLAVNLVVSRRHLRMLFHALFLTSAVAGLVATVQFVVRYRAVRALHPSQDPALSIRLEMWHAALRMMRAHPWLGVGPNNIDQVYALYLPPGKSPEVGYHSHLHNNFLQFGAERGLPCLAAWMWLMAALGWHAWRIRRKLVEARWVADAAFAGWLALIVEGCFEFNFGTSPVLMVFLILVSAPFVAERVENQVDSLRSTVKSQ